MSSPTYQKVMTIMKMGVPTDVAQSALERLLKQNASSPDSMSVAVLKKIRINLEGCVVLKGDQSKLPGIKQQLDAVA
jgi:hypothetical protein